MNPETARRIPVNAKICEENGNFDALSMGRAGLSQALPSALQHPEEKPVGPGGGWCHGQGVSVH